MLFAVIIFCEVGFWLLLGAGLCARYFLKMPRLSSVLLISVPLLDVVLLAFSVLDMRSGAEAGVRHGLAAAYIGYSVMFGHQTIRWADAKFAHRFAGGPPPWKPPKHGPVRIRYEATMIAKYFGAWGVAWGVTGLIVLLVDAADRTQPLVSFTSGLSKVVLIASAISAYDIYVAASKSRGQDVKAAAERGG